MQSDVHRLEQIETQYEEEDGGRGMGAMHHIRSKTTQSRRDEHVIGWKYNDPENPHNWPEVRATACSMHIHPTAIVPSRAVRLTMT